MVFFAKFLGLLHACSKMLALQKQKKLKELMECQVHFRPPAALRPEVQRHTQLGHCGMNILHLPIHEELRLCFLQCNHHTHFASRDVPLGSLRTALRPHLGGRTPGRVQKLAVKDALQLCSPFKTQLWDFTDALS